MHDATVRAREWLELGHVSTSSIDKVTNYWRGFNALYAAKRSDKDERTKIRNYLEQTFSTLDAQEVLAVDDKALTILLSREVIDMRGNGRDTLPAMKEFDASSDPIRKLAELFMVIYQVRCNLEHGDKSPTDKRDTDLCRASAPFVAAVLDRCTNRMSNTKT